MLLRDFVEERHLAEGVPAQYLLQGQGYMVGFNMVPEQVVSPDNVEVLLQSWENWEEEEILVETMFAAAEGSSVRAQNYAELGPRLWTKLRGNLNAFVVSDQRADRVPVLDRTTLFVSSQIPENRILCLGAKNGVLFVRGEELGYIIPRNVATTIHIYDPE